jgi:hypothetical protein
MVQCSSIEPDYSISYHHHPSCAGPFTPVYRAALLSEWTAKLGAEGVPHTEATNLIKTLQDPVKVRANDMLHLDVCLSVVQHWFITFVVPSSHGLQQANVWRACVRSANRRCHADKADVAC